MILNLRTSGKGLSVKEGTGIREKLKKNVRKTFLDAYC
jgi:hypothetical protein